jgi:CMP-N,N'-diacetyllegionaminic acid synthase
MKTLFLIPARGGSKGLPGKNIKPLNGKPLINYSIDLARCFASDNDICLSTDSQDIISVAQENDLSVPFIRPAELSNDVASSYEVINHALNHYKIMGKKYEVLVLLQPTSPLRLRRDVQNTLNNFSFDLEMAVTVKESRANPYFNLFRENEFGFLEKFIPHSATRRQDVTPVYEFNGAVYVFNVKSLEMSPISTFSKVKKVIMSDLNSVDIDSQIDFEWADFLLKMQHVKLDYNDNI